MSTKNPALPIPHSWAIDAWPPHVFPGTASKARYLIRANEDALTASGALVRIGRVRVVFGAGYASWLQKHARQVAGYRIAPNRSQAEAAL